MAKPQSRNQLIDYCLRRLGHPVIEINIDDEQIEDRLDDALQMFMEYNSEGSSRIAQAVTITDAMITNKYIDLNTAFGGAYNDRILSVNRVFPINSTTSSVNFFDLKYQMRLNDINDLASGIGDLAYLEQMEQYLATIDLKLTGHPQVNFNRIDSKLYIQGDLGAGGELVAGNKVMVEMYISTDPSLGNVYNNVFMKEYTTALLKLQWGENLVKFDGITLPGGVTLNGRQIVDDAKQEIEIIRARIYNEYDTPVDFFVG
ncbi:hypothetical protein PQZ07_00715 [bacterium]|jgi:hypothetical protein|nr:hypothetical protein [bacterium]